MFVASAISTSVTEAVLVVDSMVEFVSSVVGECCLAIYERLQATEGGKDALESEFLARASGTFTSLCDWGRI